MGDEVGLSRESGCGLKDLDPLLLREQETLSAAAPHKEAGGPLLQIALHHPLEGSAVDTARPVIRRDAGGVDAAQLFSGFHCNIPSP